MQQQQQFNLFEQIPELKPMIQQQEKTKLAKETTFKTQHFSDKQKESLFENAINQESRILEFLSQNRASAFGASELWQKLRKSEKEPITSFRRALTRLNEKNKVIKLKETVLGFFGKNEHLWQLAD